MRSNSYVLFSLAWFSFRLASLSFSSKLNYEFFISVISFWHFSMLDSSESFCWMSWNMSLVSSFSFRSITEVFYNCWR